MSEIQPIWQFLLAQGDPAGAGDGGTGSFIPLPMLILAMGVLFYFIIIRPETRKRKTQQAQLEGLKKNDRVVTIGGIYGTVASVNRDADEIVLKIDESTGTKIRVSTGSIGRLVDDSTNDNKSDKK